MNDGGETCGVVDVFDVIAVVGVVAMFDVVDDWSKKQQQQAVPQAVVGVGLGGEASFIVSNVNNVFFLGWTRCTYPYVQDKKKSITHQPTTNQPTQHTTFLRSQHTAQHSTAHNTTQDSTTQHNITSP